MQPSMFNLRVPLAERDEVFLMNTLTDAQLVVSPDVAALLDRVATSTAATRSTSDERESARPAARERLPRRRTASTIAQRSTAIFTSVKSDTVGAERHGADDAAVQLRLRLLLPGRPRRLQQVRREDVARDGGARRATGSSASSTACGPRSSC